MKARILVLANGKFLPQIQESPDDPWQTVDRSVGHIWTSRANFHYGICRTRRGAIDSLSLVGVTLADILPNP